MSRNTGESLYEAHRDALHRLLCADGVKETGLPAHDIARALRLSADDTTTLLTFAESEEAVQMDLEQDPWLWVSTSRLAPMASPEAPASVSDAAPERRTWPPALAAMLILGACGYGFFALGGPPVAPQAVAPLAPPSQPGDEGIDGASRTARIAENASAKVASREIARLQQEATALRTRIASWRDAVRGTDCRAKWSVGETCYLNGRLMSETGYEREAAKLDVRSKEISHLLSSYGQAGPSPDE